MSLSVVPSWESLLHTMSAWLHASGFKINFCSRRERTAVIVEPRRHPFLRPVIENLFYALNGSAPETEHWNLMIVTSVANEHWLRDTMRPYEYSVKYMNLENLTIGQYSRLLMTPEFWEAIPSEHILIFQTDTLALRPWNTAFEAYDYLGANYYNPADILNGVGGIQGGLSYRKRSAMIACLRAITVADILAYRNALQLPPLKSVTDDVLAEDVYFTHAVVMLEKKTAPVSWRPFFSLEADYIDAPFGIHGWNKPYFTEEQRAALIWGSPFMRRCLFQASWKD